MNQNLKCLKVRKSARNNRPDSNKEKDQNYRKNLEEKKEKGELERIFDNI